MILKHKILVDAVTFNVYGEAVASADGPKSMRCAIIDYASGQVENESGERRDYSIKLITSHRQVFPYQELMNENSPLRFIYQGKTYRLKSSTAIHNFAGQAKYYQLKLVEA